MSNFYRHPPMPKFALGQYVVNKYDVLKRPYMVVGVYVEKSRQLIYELEPVTLEGNRLRGDAYIEHIPEKSIQAVEFYGNPKGPHSK